MFCKLSILYIHIRAQTYQVNFAYTQCCEETLIRISEEEEDEEKKTDSKPTLRWGWSVRAAGSEMELQIPLFQHQKLPEICIYLYLVLFFKSMVIGSHFRAQKGYKLEDSSPGYTILCLSWCTLSPLFEVECLIVHIVCLCSRVCVHTWACVRVGVCVEC